MSRASEVWGGWLFAALLILSSVAWWPGLVAGQLPKWEVLYVGAFLVCLASFRFDRITWAVLLFLGYLALSILWGEDPRQGLHQLHKLLTLAAFFFLGRWLGERPLWAIGPSVAGVLLFGVTVGWFASFGNENFATEYLVMALPLLVGFCLRGVAHAVIGSWLIVGVIAYLLWLPSRIEFVALYALLPFWLIWRGKYVAAVISLIAPLSVLPFVWGAVEQSVLARAELHFNTLSMWMDAPVFGQGFGSFNWWYPLYGGNHLGLFDRVEVQLGHHAGAAHNDYLQLLAEGGLVAFGLGALCLWLIFRQARMSLVGVAVFLAAVMCLIGFPSQMPVTGMLLAYCLGSLCAAPECGWASLSGRGTSPSEMPTSA